MLRVLRVAQFGRYTRLMVALDEARLVEEALGPMDNLLNDEAVIEALEAIVAVCTKRLLRNNRFRRALLEAVARDLISVAGGWWVLPTASALNLTLNTAVYVPYAMVT